MNYREDRAALLYALPRPASALRRVGLRRRIALVLVGAAVVALSGLVANTVAAGEHDMHHDHSMHQGHGMQDHAAHMQAIPKGVTRSVVDYALPNMVLVDKDGRPRKLLEELAIDEPVLVNFIFTTCSTICPVISGTFAKVQAKLDADGRKYRLISITIDPDQDTPARLRDYAAKYRAGENWHFLTGGKSDIVEVQKAFDAYRGNKMNHTPITLIRASVGAPWVRYDGFVEPDTLVREYRQLAANRKLARH